MQRKKYRKALWHRVAAMVLIAGLLICGCSGEKNDPPRHTQAPTTEPTAPPELLDTMEKVVAYVEEMVHAGVGEFSLVCSEEIYDTLQKVTYSAEGVERKVFHSLLNQAGVHYYSAAAAGMKKTITISDMTLYPGYEILRSVEEGTEEKLPSKLKKTLAEARSMADACRTSDPLETAKNVQSAICSHVLYAMMGSTSDGDTAAGALLNGIADCDGYADTFYLVGSLAGLEVRYQPGVASNYDLVENKLVTASHMWNLLKLDGSWRVVDVCWADREDSIDYTWFNIGRDRASRSRTWHEDLTVPLLETTDLSTRPETEYSVTSYETLDAAIREALEKEQQSFTIIFDSDNYDSRKDAFDLLGNYYTGDVFYYWDACTRVLTFIMDHEGEA